jgi:hypothetical protein
MGHAHEMHLQSVLNNHHDGKWIKYFYVMHKSTHVPRTYNFEIIMMIFFGNEREAKMFKNFQYSSDDALVIIMYL